MAQNPLSFQKPTGLKVPQGAKVTDSFNLPLQIRSPKTGKVHTIKWDGAEPPDEDTVADMLEQIMATETDAPTAPPQSDMQLIWDMARNQAGNSNVMGVPGSFGFDVLEGAMSKEARPGMGAMIGNATGWGLANALPVGRGVKIGAGLLGAILGGVGGGVSRGESLPEAGYTGLEQGALQALLGDAPVEAARLSAPRLGRIAAWAERNALQPFMTEKDLAKMLDPATGKQYMTQREAADAMAQRSLDQGYTSTMTGNRVDAANRAMADNKAARAVKVGALNTAEQAGLGVNPRRALDEFPALRNEAGRSATEYDPNTASIDAVADRYMNHPMFQTSGTNMLPVTQPAHFQGPFPVDRNQFGGKGFFGMGAPPQQVAVGQQAVQSPMTKVMVSPTEFDEMMVYTGNELTPQWSKDLAKPEMDARMALYSSGADELERLDPVIGGANKFIHQNIPLADTLNRATMGQAGIREGAGIHGSGRVFLNAAFRPPMGATASAFNNLSLAGRANSAPNASSMFMTGPRQNLPNLIRAILGGWPTSTTPDINER